VAQVRTRWPLTEAIGIELSEAGCKIARRKVPDATFLQRDLVEEAEVPAHFRSWATHAVCSEVLEHVDRPDQLIRHATAYLAPGCRLVVTVPGGPMSAFDRHIGHRRHYTKQALRALLDETGLEVERIAAAGFPFHNLYRLAVMVRGRRLIGDASGRSSRLMGWTSRLFHLAFYMNLRTSPWGWQLVAIARVPT
jgi:trans-aconitate methyltransferase